MALKVIALTGPKGSGKDTVGELIREMYPQYNPKTIAFADPVKKQIQHIFELDKNNNDEYDRFKRSVIGAESQSNYGILKSTWKYVQARHVVREIGMLMRSYDEKQFTNYVVEAIRSEPDSLWVVTDLRFDNEYTVLKNLGAQMIKIIRPSYHYDGHITERGFDDHLVNHVLMNDGDLDFLKIRVESVMRNILEGFK